MNHITGMWWSIMIVEDTGSSARTLEALDDYIYVNFNPLREVVLLAMGADNACRLDSTRLDRGLLIRAWNYCRIQYLPR